MAAMELLPAGPRAWLVEFQRGAGGDPERAAQAQELGSWLRDRVPNGVRVVPGACTVLVESLVEGDLDVHELQRALTLWRSDPAVTSVALTEAASGPLVTIAVNYDGADLATVAAHWGTDVAGVIQRHTSIEFRAAFCGFAPGFSYLSGLPTDWAVPRLASPRTRVPAGSVALADSWCAVYPGASPGGWLLIGRTEVSLFDADRAEPALLPPGTRVRFVAQDASIAGAS